MDSWRRSTCDVLTQSLGSLTSPTGAGRKTSGDRKASHRVQEGPPTEMRCNLHHFVVLGTDV